MYMHLAVAALTARDEARYWLRIAISAFSPLALDAAVREVHVGISSWRLGWKTRMVRLTSPRQVRDKSPTFVSGKFV